MVNDVEEGSVNARGTTTTYGAIEPTRLETERAVGVVDSRRRWSSWAMILTMGVFLGVVMSVAMGVAVGVVSVRSYDDSSYDAGGLITPLGDAFHHSGKLGFPSQEGLFSDLKTP